MKIKSIFAREDVRKQLVAYGVDPDDAASRVAAMSEEELQRIQGKIADLPAGEGVFAVLGVVLVVLIVLELFGVTNVFNHL
jgi:predicted RNA methylase